MICVLLSALGACMSQPAFAQPNLNGETGYINMPSGRIEADGTFRMGYSFAEPYSNLWSSITLLPRVELYARYVRIMSGAIGAPGSGWENYGDYKDKAASGKVLLLEEDWLTPSVAFGIDDVQGTGLFKSKYLAASKQFGALDTTLGVGTGRIKGCSPGRVMRRRSGTGLRWRRNMMRTITGRIIWPRKPGWISAKRASVWRWNTAGAGWAPSLLGAMANPVSTPMRPFRSRPGNSSRSSTSRRRIPKWWRARPLRNGQSDPQYQRDLIGRLLEQDFKNVQLKVSGHVGRGDADQYAHFAGQPRGGARRAQYHVARPRWETREIRINYTVSDHAVRHLYLLRCADRLQRYFNGLESRKQLAPYVAINYAEPQQNERARKHAGWPGTGIFPDLSG